mgnify:CR=1 FL=1
MDTLTYYINEECISVFRLKTEEKVQNLGSDPNNEFVIKENPNIDLLHVKIQYRSGSYQFMVVSNSGAAIEDEIVPFNEWIALPPDKKIWLTSSLENGYLIFRQDAARQMRARRKTMQMEFGGTLRQETRQLTQVSVKNRETKTIQKVNPEAKSDISLTSSDNLEIGRASCRERV